MENRLNSADSSFDVPTDEEDNEKAFSPSQYLEDNSFNQKILLNKKIMKSKSHSIT